MAWGWRRWWCSTRSGWKPSIPIVICRNPSTMTAEIACSGHLHFDHAIGVDCDVRLAAFNSGCGHLGFCGHGHAVGAHVRARRHELCIEVQLDNFVAVAAQALSGDIGTLSERLDGFLDETVFSRGAAAR